MNILIKSSNGITQVSADSKLMSQRKVFIEGEINAETACDFLKKIMILNAEDSNRPIDILINTPGGCINSGMLIYDVIQPYLPESYQGHYGCHRLRLCHSRWTVMLLQ